MQAIWKGERLRMRRKQLGLTMKELASKIGAVKSNIAIWEGGGSTPKGEYLVVLCEALNVHPIDFFEIEKNEEQLKDIKSSSAV